MVLRQQTIFGLLVADSLLYHAQQERGCLPLYFVRAETDGSRSASELASGAGIEKFSGVLRNKCDECCKKSW